MDEREEERVVVEETPPRVERETTVVTNGGGGGGGAIIAVVLLLVVVVLLFLYFSGYLGRAADETDININVDTPALEVPEVRVPDIDVNLPPPEQPAKQPEPTANSS